jgi:MFS family permease
LLTLAALSSVVICSWMPIESVVLPTLFQADGRSGHLGILLMAMSAGSVAGALLYGAIAHLFPRRPILLCALIGTSAAAAAMAALPQLSVMAVLALVSGLLYGPVNPIVNTAIQERTPAHLRGRTIGTMNSITYAAGPAGFLIAGPLVSTLGVQISFAVLGVVMLGAAMSSPFLPALRLLDAPGRRLAASPEPDDLAEAKASGR